MADYSDLIGVSFKNHGRDVKTGLDCYGLVMEVFKRNGVILPEFDAEFDDIKKISSIIHGTGISSWSVSILLHKGFTCSS